MKRKSKSIDTSLFGAFKAAAEEGSFTLAAQKMHLTQSAISQQVAKLEAQIGTPLFQRVNKKVLLTEAGKKLLQFASEHEEAFERFLDEFHQNAQTVSGKVSYAMPHSCLFTPHFPLLLKKRKKVPGLKLHVNLCANEEVIEKLLHQEVDFGFVTKRSQNPAVIHHEFAEEKYILAAPKSFGRDGLKTSKEIGEIPFIDYPGMSVLFDLWKDSHFPAAKRLSLEALQIAGSINSIHGAVTMVEEEMGCSVFPEHCMEKSIQSGKVKVLRGPSSALLANKIFIVTLLPRHRLLRRINHVIDMFFEMKGAAKKAA